jgi:hypothetical protein
VLRELGAAELLARDPAAEKHLRDALGARDLQCRDLRAREIGARL